MTQDNRKTASVRLPNHMVPVSGVIAQFGVELRTLAGCLHAVEAAIEHLTNASHSSGERVVFGTQNLDLIGQTLEALAIFADRLSGAVPQDLEVDTDEATRWLTLDALAARLRLAPHDAGAAPVLTVSDVELFD